MEKQKQLAAEIQFLEQEWIPYLQRLLDQARKRARQLKKQVKSSQQKT